MRIAIVGSRNYPFQSQVIEYILSLPQDTVIVSGGASGVDTWAVSVARTRGLDIEIYHADWEQYGKAAGPIRNRVLVDSGIDRLVAFWDGKSRGTRDVIQYARRKIGFDRVEVRQP